MNDFVSRRLVSGWAETRRPRELPRCWSQRFDSLAERYAEQSEDADCRQERNKSRHLGHFMCLIFVEGIHEHETCGALRVIGSEHADVETRDGGPDEHHRSANSAADEEFGQLARDAACCPRRRAGIAVTHTCPVVGAGTRESSNIRLDEAPVSTRAAESRVEDDGRRAVPGAPQMQPVRSDVDEMSGRRSRRELLSRRKPLVRGAGECGNDKERAQHDKNAHRPAPHVDISRQIVRSADSLR